MEKHKELILWLNGEQLKNSYQFFYCLTEDATLIELKENIASFLKRKDIVLPSTSILLYTDKEIKLEESDIPYLTNKQILFVVKANDSFNQSNYFFQYQFVKWIKAGGYGEVFLARHVITKKEFAIKQIDTASFSSQDLYNISREHVILQSFRHKNIIKWHSSFVYNEHFFTVMDYAKGGELREYVKEKGGLKEGEAKKIFKQICNAVNYIHGKNLIHRDLKPNNILFLDKDKTEIVLIDFGISGFSNGNTKEKIFAGTTKFQPPEMADGSNYTSSAKIDVWALGVILFYMIYNTLPFNGKNDKEINKAISNHPVQFPTKPRISRECKDIVSEMLEKNPKYRIELNSEQFDKWLNTKDDNSKQSLPIRPQKKHSDILRRYTYMSINSNIRQHINDFLMVIDDNDNNNNEKHNKKPFHVTSIKKTKTIQLPLINPMSRNQSININGNSKNSNKCVKNPIKKINSYISSFK